MSNFTNRETFSSFMTTMCSCGKSHIVPLLLSWILQKILSSPLQFGQEENFQQGVNYSQRQSDNRKMNVIIVNVTPTSNSLQY